jgi:hypothetical protein
LKSLQFARIGSGLVIGMLLQACGTLPRLDAVPPALTERAAISAIPNSRYWLGQGPLGFLLKIAWVLEALSRVARQDVLARAAFKAAVHHSRSSISAPAGASSSASPASTSPPV